MIRRYKLGLFIVVSLIIVILLATNDNKSSELKQGHASGTKGRITEVIKEKVPERKAIVPVHGSPVSGNEGSKSIEGDSNVWLPITNDVRVYSAFWDDRQPPFAVKVVAVGLNSRRGTSFDIPLNCHLKYVNNDKATKHAVTYEDVEESHETTDISKFIFCVPNNGLVPAQVGFSLISNKTGEPAQWIPVRKVFNQARVVELNNITACVRPLHGPYSSVLELVEFVAFYDVLGVDSFVFYDYEVTDAVKLFLVRLKDAGLDVTLRKWDLPNMERTWAVGQAASVQDCVYKSVTKSRLVLVADLDEFVIPRKRNTIPDLINYLSKDMDKLPNSFVFRHASFCLELQSEYPPKASMPLLTQFKVKRLEEILQAGYKAKYLAYPEAVQTAGVHGVTKYLTTHWGPSSTVPIEEGLLHHYRSDTVACLSAAEDDAIRDPTARRYETQLAQSRVLKIYQNVFRKHALL